MASGLDAAGVDINFPRHKLFPPSFFSVSSHALGDFENAAAASATI